MMHPDDALRLIENLDIETLPLESDELPLEKALGRLLAWDLVSRVDQPPFDKAAMDGFAWGDPPRERFKVVQTIAAGSFSNRPLAAGQCARIMTGAPLPLGATRVQRIEWTEETADGVRFTEAESTNNVIRRGENQRAGDPLLNRRILRPADIGILASSGYASIPVLRQPVTGILSTGDELRSPGQALDPGTIYDSNGPQLAAQAQAAGCRVISYGRLPDREPDLDAAIRGALAECDLVILSGGVSMGDFDFVPRVLQNNGVEKLFHNLAMKPGKPTFLGRKANVLVLGLPGNPVSTFVNFEIMAKAVLRRLQGLPPDRPTVRTRAAVDIRRRTSERVEFFPARIEAGEVRPIRYTGSSMLNALAEANALIRMEIDQTLIEKGLEIDVRPI